MHKTPIEHEKQQDLHANDNATLIGREDLSDELAVFRIRSDSGNPPFVPGQYATLGLPWGDPVFESPDEPHPQNSASLHPSGKLIRRAYSIASAPSQTDHLEFLITRVAQGRFTSRLWAHQLGDRIWMDTKIRGHFTLEHVPPTSDLLMVGTGTGVAPYISMLREFESQHRWARVALLHGARYIRDLGYAQELRTRAQSDKQFEYVPMVTREAPDIAWDGGRGRVQVLLGDAQRLEDLSGIRLDPDRCHVMLCGSPQMIDDTRALLTERGFQIHERGIPGNVHFERYW